MSEHWQQWQAHRQITDLLHRYASLIDGGDVEGVGALFAHAVLAFRSPSGDERIVATGAQQAADALSRSNVRYADGTFLTKHVITNIRIELADDCASATASSYVTVFQATPELPLQAVFAGRYHDAFSAVDGSWQFTRRVAIADLLGDLSQHVAAASGSES
jgi:3-phenylpropionate/cinnamic acid dioxygenase small subunit